MLNRVFISVLNMSLVASYAIVFVSLARLLLKKAPKVFSYALWAVVLVRLMCPFSFESAIGLLPNNPQPIPQDIVYQQAPQIDTGINIIDNSVNGALPPVINPTESVNPLQIWTFIGSHIWLIGIVIMIIYSIFQLLNLRKKLIGATPLKGNIYLADQIVSPFVIGFIKPKIYLPSDLSEVEQEFIIKHEQCHIKRLDHITRILSFIALSLHWFNPLVWIAFILSCKDMELSCDESVMKKMDADIRYEYSLSLLKFATGRKLIAATPLAFGEGDTKDRVKNVMKYKKPVVWVSAICLVLVCVVTVCLITNSKGSILKRDSMKQAQNLSVKDVDQIELVTLSNGRDGYHLFDENVFDQIIQLVNESNGRYVENPKPIAGGGETLYITKKDGNILTVGNNGNVYLFINDDSFTASKNFLKKFENFVANDPIPKDFHYGQYETVDSANARIAEFEAIEIGTAKESVREKFGEPSTYGNWRYAEIYLLENAQITINYTSDNKTDSFVKNVNINTHARLSLNDIIMLSRKGEDLTWSDFEDYPYIEGGSGLYIRNYHINNSFGFSIGGGLTDNPPIYMTLYTKTEDNQSIDIRTENVTKFISLHSMNIEDDAPHSDSLF